METTSIFKARCLKIDLGVDGGIRYAEGIAAMNGESAFSYKEAAEILRRELTLATINKAEESTDNQPK
jgi:hypothetical protein